MQPFIWLSPDSKKQYSPVYIFFFFLQFIWRNFFLFWLYWKYFKYSDINISWALKPTQIARISHSIILAYFVWLTLILATATAEVRHFKAKRQKNQLALGKNNFFNFLVEEMKSSRTMLIHIVVDWEIKWDNFKVVKKIILAFLSFSIG